MWARGVVRSKLDFNDFRHFYPIARTQAPPHRGRPLVCLYSRVVKGALQQQSFGFCFLINISLKTYFQENSLSSRAQVHLELYMLNHFSNITTRQLPGCIASAPIRFIPRSRTPVTPAIAPWTNSSQIFNTTSAILLPQVE